MTAQPSNPSIRLLPLGILAVALLVFAMVWVLRHEQKPLPVVNQIHPFALTNQSGALVRLSDLQGSVWVANIIFTRCPGPCLQMSRRMAALQKRWEKEPRVRMISLTADPEFDTPEVLKAYARKVGADLSRWNFLTGTKADIVHLAVDELKLTAQETPPAARENPEDLFIHSTISVLIDTRGRLRASVEALESGSETRFDDFISRLLKE